MFTKCLIHIIHLTRVAWWKDVKMYHVRRRNGYQRKSGLDRGGNRPLRLRFFVSQYWCHRERCAGSWISLRGTAGDRNIFYHSLKGCYNHARNPDSRNGVVFKTTSICTNISMTVWAAVSLAIISLAIFSFTSQTVEPLKLL